MISTASTLHLSQQKYISDLLHRASMFDCKPISTPSSKQRVVSRSSAESEYRSLANATAELIWIEALLTELHLSLPLSPDLLCDNLSATQLAANPILHARTKHIEIDFHFIRERVVNKSLQVHFTPSKEQLADIFTKPLPTQRFQSLRTKLTALPSPISLWGDDKALIRVIS